MLRVIKTRRSESREHLNVDATFICMFRHRPISAPEEHDTSC